jgi:hypothetical protein
MPRRRSERARRRIEARTRENALRLEKAAVAEGERTVRLKWARHKTQIEVMENRGVLSARQCAAAWRIYRDFSAAGDLTARSYSCATRIEWRSTMMLNRLRIALAASLLALAATSSAAFAQP